MKSLSPEDRESIDRMAAEIVSGRDRSLTEFQAHVVEVLTRHVLAADAEYAAKLADEETHRWDFGHHSIAECRIDWCGRYRGQRRDSREPQ